MDWRSKFSPNGVPFSDLHCLYSPETLNSIKKSNPSGLNFYPFRLEIGLRSPKWLRDEILLVAEIGIRLGWPATGDGRFFSVPVGRYRVPGCWWLPVPGFYPRLRLSGLT